MKTDRIFINIFFNALILENKPTRVFCLDDVVEKKILLLLKKKLNTKKNVKKNEFLSSKIKYIK